MPSDALSDVLRCIRLSGGLFFRVELSAPFAVTSMGHEELHRSFSAGAEHVLPFHMVTAGAMWFDVDGEAPVELHPNDIIVLPRGTEHALVDRPGRPPRPVNTLQHKVSGSPPTLRHGGGGPVASALCGFFRCHGRLFNPLLDALPSVMVFRGDHERGPWLSITLQRAFSEGVATRPGGEALVQRLTELLFVEVVQAHLEQEGGAGWLAGLRDPVVGAVLREIHAAPATPWTVEALARRVGVSRSSLAQRFRDAVGMSPIRYLTAWRMELAADRMLTTDDALAQIADRVGYDSEASFNRAFKRHVGVPPAAWRRSSASDPVRTGS